MRLNIITSQNELPVKKGYMISLIIKKLKGHKYVEVHLFLPEWDENEAKSYDWSKLLGDPIDRNAPADPVSSRKVLLESFTLEERDMILDCIRFEEIPNYTLPFPVHGLYILSQHEPVEEEK